MIQPTDRRYGTAAWKRRRAAHLSAHPLCVMCSALGLIVPASVADHIVPHRGGDAAFWEGALQSLCASCHYRHKQATERSGKRTGNAADGSPLDPAHHWNRPGG
jgi:5-methylcytosine-specific restriction protein A